MLECVIFQFYLVHVYVLQHLLGIISCNNTNRWARLEITLKRKKIVLVILKVIVRRYNDETLMYLTDRIPESLSSIL